MTDLYRIAQTYKGTPHINGGDIKGAGLDCCTLITHLIAEHKGVNIPVEFGYSGDWFCRKNCREILLPYLERHFERVAALEPGDVISYKWGRSQYAHLAMYLGNNLVIHCKAEEGVEITDINNPLFNDRTTGVWRLK